MSQVYWCVQHVPHEKETRSQGNVSLMTYYGFFKAGGELLLLVATLAVFVLGEVSIDHCLAV